MRILLLGANGFIGRHLLARLAAAGHDVVPAVRRPAEADRLLPAPAAIAPASIAIDLNHDTRPADWLPRLAGIDAVVNCAGILQARPGQSIAAIHADGPLALFAACAQAGVRRVIQISAISAEAAAPTAYAATKRAADTALAASDLDWVILRPSLVYAAGAYGGTALFRALAALPVTPLVGAGDQPFQPIHVDDVAAALLRVLADPAINRVVIDPVGPDRLTLARILADLRRWLGYAPAPALRVPLPLVRLAARLGDRIGGPVNSTAVAQLLFGNAGDPAAFVAATGVRPRAWAAALGAHPAQAQDRWHARLYFVRPLLRWTLALMWLVSGAVGLFAPPSLAAAALGPVGLAALAPLLAWGSCALDLVIAAALVVRWRPGLVAAVQLVVIAGYTAVLSLGLPGLWTDPFGPLLKNLPVAAAVLALAAIEPDR
jgi:uncharacterized protein YbjT (DUF2867 family)